MTKVIEKTEHKKGYKKTKLGWIPEDWEVIKLGSIIEESTLKSSVENQLPVLTSSRRGLMYQTDYYNEQNVIFNKSNIGFNILPKGYITYRSRSDDGFFTFNLNKLADGIVSIYYPVFKTKFNDYFICSLLNISSKILYKYAIGSSQKVLAINDLSKILYAIPKIEEQEKIAEILSAWDDGIETLEKLIEQKEILKKATMQKLFLEKESWKMMRFDKIFKDFCKKNCPRERLLSATQENGVIPRDMLSGKVMSPEGSLDGYKLIEAGDFVISLRSFQGGLEYSKYRGILSPAYTVLKNIIDIDKDFYRHFLKSYKFIEKYLSISVIGIRDGKQISYSDLSSVKIPYPPLEEQEKIGKILNCYDEELQLLNSKLEKLKEQKKGLMQKLLTGQIRVKV